MWKSAYIAPNHHWRIYREANYTGEDWLDIRGRWTVLNSWIGQVKSMALQHWDDCAYLYDDPNKAGYWLRICNSADLPPKWRNRAVSLVIEEKVTMIMYKELNYTGESLTLVGPEESYNLPDGWVGNIQSIELHVEKAMPKNMDGGGTM